MAFNSLYMICPNVHPVFPGLIEWAHIHASCARFLRV